MVKKVIDYFGTDGLLHIICSSILVSVLSWVFPLLFAIGATMLIGIAKELIWDKALGKGSCERKDVVADFIGTIIGIL